MKHDLVSPGNLLAGRCVRVGVEGFVYVPNTNPGAFAGAVVGQRCGLSRAEPPWIVVDHELSTVVVASWPGRLLRVRTVEPGSRRDRAAVRKAMQELAVGVWYTRASIVDVLDELNPAELFGPHGAAVGQVIDWVASLERDTAVLLAQLRSSQADAIYSSAWHRWIREDSARAEMVSFDEDLSGTLGVYGRRGAPISPVGKGLQVLSDVFWRFASSEVDPAAVATDPEGEESLVEPWASAHAALLDAVMAFGAPTLTSETERTTLLRPWAAVGQPPRVQ